MVKDEYIVEKILVDKLGIIFDISKLFKVSIFTTNTTYIYNCEIVLKKIEKELRFLSEMSVYDNKYNYSFNIPELLGTFIDESNNFWLITVYFDSLNILEFSTKHNHIDKILVNVIYAISDFEIKSQNIGLLGTVNWSMKETLQPLLSYLKKVEKDELVELLIYILDKGDNALNFIEKKPCIDAYFQNILISKNKKQNTIIFCDFDKAYRAIPVGEQLSHFFMHKEFIKYNDSIIDIYSKCSMHRKSDIIKVLNLVLFCRALSGIRDSLFEIHKKKYVNNVFIDGLITMSIFYFILFADELNLPPKDKKDIKILLINLKNKKPPTSA